MAVAGGDRDPALPVGDKLLRLCIGELRGYHCAAATRLPEQPGPPADHPHGVFQAEGARDVCRRYLTQAVPYHDLRLYPPRPPQRGQRDLDSEDGGLDYADVAQPGMVLVGEKLRDYGSVQVRAHSAIAHGQRVPEHRLLRV
jgi:hypothetical protein